MTGRSLLMDALTDVQNLHSYILLFLYPAKTGRLPNQDMAKIQNISEIHPTFWALQANLPALWRTWHKVSA